MECSHPECHGVVVAQNRCRDHYRPVKRVRSFGTVPKGTKCCIAGCDRPYLAKGVCKKHYHGLYRYGDPMKRFRRSQGEGSVNHHGYRVITAGGVQVLEHRHVMAAALGRALLPEENVHHRNGDRLDNRLVPGHEIVCPGGCCNLELWSKKQPPGQRVVDKLAWAREIIRLYGGMCEGAVAAAE